MANTFRKIYKKTGSSGTSSDYTLIGNVGVNGVELDIMKGASSSAVGEIGLVPKPTKETVSMVLKSNGEWQSIFPVGAIYLSATNNDPSLYFGGTWERISKGRFLVGVDEDDDEFGGYGWYGGEKEVKLDSNSMPVHGHKWNVTEKPASLSGYGTTVLTLGSATSYWTNNAGGGASHNNLPPFWSVYIWRRTA